MENINNNKKSRRKGYEAIILLLLTISLFITATYAWFTDSAFSKGNKVFSGNLYVDVVETEKVLQDIYQTEWENYNDANEPDISFSDFLQTVKGYKLYERKYQDGEDVVTDNYYIITGTDAGTINLYNMEPGQVKDVSVKYINKGDLALSAAGAIKIDLKEDGTRKSFTGIETLLDQYRLLDNEITDSGFNDFYKNKYSVNIDSDGDGILDRIDPELIKDGIDENGDEHSYYEISNGIRGTERDKILVKRFKKLFAMWGKDINNLEDGDIITVGEYNNITNLNEKTKFINLSYTELTDLFNEDGYSINATNCKQYIKNDGGHLEDVLEVYIGVDNNNVDRDEVYVNRDKTNNKYYFGTLTEFIYLLDNGPFANKDFDYDAYATLTDTEEEAFYTNKLKELKDLYDTKPEELSIEETYMAMYDNLKANLYSDYERYLSNANGHCLPVDSITTEGVIPSKDGVEVKVYENGEVTHTYMASEMGECSFSLYLPENVDSKYQNASISLSMGVTATQADFEMDDTGYMIYDESLSGPTSANDLKAHDMFVLKSEKMNSSNPYLFLRVIKSEGDLVTAVMMPVDNIIYYENIANDGVIPQTSTFTGEYSDALTNFGVNYNHFDYSKSNVINYLNDEESKFYKAFKNGFPELYAAIVDEPIIQSLIIPALIVQSAPGTNDFINLTKTNGDYYTIYSHEGFSNYEFIVLGKYESQDKFKFRTASILDMLDYIDTNYITCNEIYELFMGDEVGFNEIEEANTDDRSGGDKLIDNYGQCIGFSDVLLFSGGGGVGLIDKQVDYSFRDNVTYYTNLYNKCAVVPVFTFKNDGSFKYEKIGSLTDFYNDNISEGKPHLSYVDSIEKGQTIDIKLDYNNKSSLVGCRVLDVDENPNGEKIVTVATMIPKLETVYDEKLLDTLPYYGIFGSEFNYPSSNLYYNVSKFNNMLKGDENLSSALVELNDYNKTYMFDFTGNAPEVGDRFIVYDNNGLTNNCINKGAQPIAGDDSMPKYARSISMDDLINYYGNESNIDKVDLMIFFRNYDTVDTDSREFKIWLSDADPNSKGRFCVKAIKNDGEEPSKVYINCGESYANKMYNSFVFKFNASKFKDFVIKKSCENTSVIIG